MESISRTIRRSVMAWHEVRGGAPATASFDLPVELCRLIDGELRVRWSRRETLSRLAATNLLNTLPYGLYRPITTVLKRMRGRGQLAPVPAFTPGAYADLLRCVSSARAPTRLIICLTHDIDTAHCAEYWPRVIAAERAANVKSASHVLVSGPYRLDRGWLNELEQDGFELALHGDSHDMAFGFRRPERIRQRLRRCLDVLGVPIVGYRAPAFAISEPLLECLADLGFRYDSSVRANVYYRSGLDACAPYLYPGLDLWEMPLTVQDDGLFRDAGLDEDAALHATLETVRLCAEHDGLFIMNTHPVGLREHPAYYERFLQAVASETAYEVMLPRDLAARLDAAARALVPATSETEP